MTLFSDTTAVFPNNVVEVVAARMTALWGGDLTIVKRRLHVTDRAQSIGVFPDTWAPDENSYEFVSQEPTVQRYVVKVQAFAKDSVEERGIATHSVMAKAVRSMLYNDAALAVGLNALSVTMFGKTERIQRRGCDRQRFINNEVSGQFLYLSTLDYYVETETK